MLRWGLRHNVNSALETLPCIGMKFRGIVTFGRLSHA